jgi:hypothetical protein
MATRKPIGDGEVFAPEPTNGAEDQIAYDGPMDFLDVLSLAGKVVGLADHRPTYGRFAVTNFVTREA